jgi:hypothetical protein
MAFGIDDALIVGTILASLFGGSKGQKQTTTTEQTDPRYRSPAIGFMEPLILSMLTGNAQAMGGAGMPGGASRFGEGSSTMMNDVLSLLGKDWGGIMKGYDQKGGTDCEAKCRQTYSEHTDAPDAWKKFQECKAKCGQSS